MNKLELKKFKQEAWTAGENDIVTETYLVKGAQLFIENEIKDELNDEQHDELIEAYREGFLGKKI